MARRQIGDGWATGNLAGTSSFQAVPFVGQNSTDLAATLSGIQGDVINQTLQALRAQSSTGASGMGSLTEREADRLAAAVGALQQNQSAQKLRENLAIVERHYRNALALLNNEDPRDTAVAERYGIITEAPTQQNERGSELTSEGRLAADPALAGVNATVARMVRDGRSEPEIRAYMNRVRPGLGDRVRNLAPNIEYSRQHPAANPSVDVEREWVANGGPTAALGEIGMSPFGSYVVGAGDMATMGTLDNFAENPDLARAVMGGLSERNPNSYLGGQITGGVLAGLGAEAGAARAGITGLARVIAPDIAIGAGYGAGSADEEGDSRLGGALLGGVTGYGGGAIGRGASRSVGRLLTGITDPVRRALNARRVPMTVGQILGGGAHRTEDRLAGLPFVGDQIRARRIEGMEGFNRAAFDEALAPVGGTTNGVIGAPGVDIARQVRSDAYSSALDPVQVQADAPFIGDMQATIAAGRQLPPSMSEPLVNYTLPVRVGESFDASGGLSGRDYQQAIRGLRRDASGMENLPYGYDFGQVTNQAEGALEGILARQSPETIPALQAANRTNMGVETVRDAVNRSRNGTRTGVPDVFSPSQLSDASARSAQRFGNNQGTTSQPFFELTRAGQEVLPSSVPDSGTAGRLALPTVALALLGGSGGAATADDGESARRGGIGALGGLSVAALLAAPNSRAARNALQRLLMAERFDAIERAGQQLIDRRRIAGLLAAPAALEATVGQ